MNAIYGLCWSTARGCFIVVSEVAKCKGKKSNRRSLSVLTNCFLLASGLMASSAHAADFVNGGFETGTGSTITGWTQGGGIFSTVQPLNPADYVTGAQYNTGNTGLISNTIVNSGFDPLLHSLGVDINMVYSGNQAVRVNDSNNNYSVSTITQTVSSYGSSTINFAWFAVMDAAKSSGHAATDSPGFIITIYDVTTSTLVSSIAYNPTIAGRLFSVNSSGSNNVYYSGWQAVSQAVTQGDTFTVTLLAADCNQRGHYGYVYLDGFGLVTPTAGPAIPDIVSGNNGSFNRLSNVAGGSTFNNRFDGGTLRVDAPGSSSDANFTITSNKGYIDQYGNSAIFSGLITNDGSDSGRLIITNSGVSGIGKVTLTDTANSYSGGTEVQAGATLSITNPLAIGAGGLDLVGSSTVPATLETTGSMTIRAHITVSGDPVFNVVSGTTTISSPITNGGLPGDVVVSGAGTLELTAINTYTGATSVNSGSTLALSGSGSITTSSALNNSGTVDIRGASGNVALGGTLTQAPTTGSLLMNISPTNNQKVLVTGAASLAGNLSLYASPGTYIAGKYTLITANGVTGTFETFSSTLPNYTRLAYKLGYDANNVYLFLTPNVADTQTSLNNNLAGLQGIFNLQTSTINNGLNYDCSLFDVHGLCISTGGRYTNTNTPTGDSTGALVIGGYRVNDHIRVGVYLDQLRS